LIRFGYTLAHTENHTAATVIVVVVVVVVVVVT